jgi:hypothetical protein
MIDHMEITLRERDEKNGLTAETTWVIPAYGEGHAEDVWFAIRDLVNYQTKVTEDVR